MKKRIPASSDVTRATSRALSRLFGPLDAETLEWLQSDGERVELRRGETLLRQGDRSDSIYVLVSGRLHAMTEEPDGRSRVVGQIVPGESIGEMALFADEPRSVTVYAIRDSLLLEFSGDQLERALQRDPRLLRNLMRVVFQRLQRANRSPRIAPPNSSIALIPAHPAFPLREFATRLATALDSRGRTLHLNAERVGLHLEDPGIASVDGRDPRSGDLISWLGDQESEHRFLILEGDLSPSAWSARCVRQADWILLLAESRADPASVVVDDLPLRMDRTSVAAARRTLILLHEDGSRLPSGTRRWLDALPVDDHLHLRRNELGDFARLARHLDGSAIGLALGGGGARAFAHIGIIRALQEEGIPIDMVNGTSMGAAIAAQHALGWSPEKMLEMNHHVWVERRPHARLTLPLLSLISARGAADCARFLYGDARIEDLWIPFCCISSNLTRAEMMVHREGSLLTAVTASSSLPGIAIPVLDGEDLLVDGALFNNLPGDVMRSLGCGRLMVASTSLKDERDFRCDRVPGNWEVLLQRLRIRRALPRFPSITEMLVRSALLGSINRQEAVIRDADYCFDPPLGGFRLMEFSALERIVDAGYTHARQQLGRWKQDGSLERLLAPTDPNSPPPTAGEG